MTRKELVPDRKLFSEMSKLERELCDSLVRHKAPITFNEAELTIWFLGRPYSVTPNQYAVIFRLWSFWLSHADGLNDTAFCQGNANNRSAKSPTGYVDRHGFWLLTEGGQVKDSFKKSPLWGFLVIRGRDRRLKLNLPQFPPEPVHRSSTDDCIGPPALEALMARKRTAQIFSRNTPSKRKKSRRTTRLKS